MEDGSEKKGKPCIGCGQSGALMGCPKCLKLNLLDSVFCSQDCFTKNWVEHKKIHPIKESEAKLAEMFNGYKFTGDLRPHPRSAQILPSKLPKDIELPDYAHTGIPVGEQTAKLLRQVSPVVGDEIRKLREACLLGRKALDDCAMLVKPGVTGEEINNRLHDFVVNKNKAYPSPLNYRNFPKSVCVSVNEVICHGIPDRRPLVDGDIVNIDVTVYLNGYHADLNETYYVGDVNKIDDDSKRLVAGAYDCLMEAINICRPGTLYREVGRIISKVAKERKLSVVRTYCGHGVGKLFHCPPDVPHYAKNKAVGKMEVGHVFTIEPMINLGSFDDDTWPDDWTSVTVDGKRSAQFEHTLIITEDGCEVLTARLSDSPFWDKNFEKKVENKS